MKWVGNRNKATIPREYFYFSCAVSHFSFPSWLSPEQKKIHLIVEFKIWWVKLLHAAIKLIANFNFTFVRNIYRSGFIVN